MWIGPFDGVVNDKDADAQLKKAEGSDDGVVPVSRNFFGVVIDVCFGGFGEYEFASAIVFDEGKD